MPAATSARTGPRPARRCATPRQSTSAEQQDRRPRADEAELLPRHGEDEVGLLLGDELALGLRAVEQPLARPCRRSRWRSGPGRCCSRCPAGRPPGRRTPRTGPSGTGASTPAARCATPRRSDADQRAARAASAPASPDTARTPRTMTRDDDRGAEVGLQHDQPDRHGRNGQREPRRRGRAVGPRRPRARRASSPGRRTARPWRTPTAAPRSRRAARSTSARR